MYQISIFLDCIVGMFDFKKNCCLSCWVGHYKKDIKWILFWDQDTISNNSWGGPKHASAILYNICIWSSIISTDDYESKILVSPEKQ